MAYLKSEHRKHVEEGMPYYIAQLGSVVIRDMLKQYVTMHETGLDHTAEHLYEVFIENHKNIY